MAGAQDERARPVRTRPRLTDARSQRSQRRLQEALLELIAARDLDRITLRNITDQAGVSYPTFFNHYASKEELFQAIALAEISALITAFRKDVDSPAWRPGRGMCDHVVQRRGLWHTLLTAGASDAMRAEFIRRGRDLAAGRPDLPHGFAVDLVSGVIASGTFEIIAWWLAQDAEHSAATVADMLETMVIEPALGLPPGWFTGREAAAAAAP